MCFSATMRSPLRSKRAMISPVRPRAKASGFTRIRVLSIGAGRLSSRRVRRRPVLLICAFAALPLLLLFVVCVAQSGRELFPLADHAGLEAETINALHFRQLYGTFSRFGWYH